MNMIDDLMKYFWDRDEKSQTSSVKVPNGWGRQNYQGKANKAEYNDRVDLNNIKNKRGWIQAYAAEKFHGVHTYSGAKNQFYPYYSITYKRS